MKKAYTLFILIFCCANAYGQSTEENNLWFGFMEFRPIEETNLVVMITSEKAATGTVNMPLLDWSMPFSVAANEVTIVRLPLDAETKGSETISATGIQIQSRIPVKAYMHQFFGFSSEASAILPMEVVGTEYFVMSYPGVQDSELAYLSQFLIVGTADGTTVTITPSSDTKGGKKTNIPFTIELNEGETYQVQANNAVDDLTGTHIIAAEKIVVMGGTAWAEIPVNCGTRDNLIEQMHPVDTWGTRVVTIPSYQVAFDVFRILAAEDNTSVEVQGTTTETYELNKGEFVEYQLSEPTLIIGSKPILVAQYLIGQSCNEYTFGDPSMVLLNNTSQVRGQVNLFSSPFQDIQEHYINIVTRTPDTEIILFDGQKLTERNVNFTPVGIEGDFSYARIEVDSGVHTIASEGCGVIVSAYGYGAAESYAYSGDVNSASLSVNDLPEGGCLNDTVFFDTGLSPIRYDFQWDLGDGNNRATSQFEYTYTNLGTYPVELILEDKCFTTTDTINKDLLISLREAVQVTDIQICENEPLQLKAAEIVNGRYEWRGPEGLFFEAQSPIIDEAKINRNGTYNVISTVSGCASFPAFFEVAVNPNPVPYLGEDTVICPFLFETILDAGDYAKYRWQDGTVNPSFVVETGGVFFVEVTDEFGCVGIDDIVLTQECQTDFFIPNVFSPNGDNKNDRFLILGDEMSRMHLQIFNRWGEFIFETKNQKMGWDGNLNGGDLAPTGVYIYRLDFEGNQRDGSIFRGKKYGTITLVR